MQNELEANYPALDISLLGVNSYDQQSGNASATTGRDIPWLQDVDSNGNGISDLWASWGVTPRDVVILDGANKKVGTYNLTVFDLEETQNYNTLRQMLIDAATPATAAPWQNPANRLDVNNDTLVTPVADVLTLINELNAHTIIDAVGRLPNPPVAPNLPPPYYDVSGDGFLSPVLDVLPVINHLNGVSGEGEGIAAGARATESPSAVLAAAPDEDAAWYAMPLVSVTAGHSDPPDPLVAAADAPRRAADVPHATAAPAPSRRAAALADTAEETLLDPVLDALVADLDSIWHPRPE